MDYRIVGSDVHERNDDQVANLILIDKYEKLIKYI